MISGCRCACQKQQPFRASFSKEYRHIRLCQFKPNRAVIAIEHIGHKPVKLRAYDLEDGSEGIYIENSFRADARQQLIGDVVDDINVAGVPQVSGIKQLFRRNNRNVKVTVMDGYQLTLKLKQ